MDPNANLSAQEALFKKHVMFTHESRCQLVELRNDLAEWLRNGGFEPDWSRCPSAAMHWKTKGYGKKK